MGVSIALGSDPVNLSQDVKFAYGHHKVASSILGEWKRQFPQFV